MTTTGLFVPHVSNHPMPEECRVSAVRVLRLSVTDRCNFRCRYCMPKSGVPWVPHQHLLSLESLCDQVRWLCGLTALNRVRLTGGEPLVRPGISHLIRAMRAIPQIREVALTTNGSLLAGHASELKAAGLSRVNISLDSLDEDRFTMISRGGILKHTLQGIEAALTVGLTPLKLNAVLLLSSWRKDVPRLLDYAADVGVEIRFIELMRTGTERSWCESELVMVDEAKAWLTEHAEVRHVDCPSASPAQRMHVIWRGRPIDIGWIAPRSHPFCSRCERLRMDAQGRLRRCLMDPALLDLRSLRASNNAFGASMSFVNYMAGKQLPEAMNSMNAMSRMGG